MYVTQFARFHFTYALARLAESQRCAPSEDDRGMDTAAADDLLGWADDLESRVGLHVTEFRAALLDFIIARDGGDDPDMVAHGDRLRAAYHADYYLPGIAAEGHRECADGLPILCDLLDNEAWHNDAALRLTRYTVEGDARVGLVLWVDVADPALREVDMGPRYALYQTDAEGQETFIDGTDDPAQVRALVQTHIARGL